ncbi:MAG: DNA-directed RNA polymerase subunit beta' [Clostridium sp.]|nr:DNA-directed RNA polymerase subunit beta' [Clostridium sp.]
MFELNNFDAIQIGLASPEQVRKWSRGEVKKPETINYRTLKPERDGLFCERIFGPMKDWECHCGKYKRVRYKGIVCDRCGVEVTKAKVRRERMGHIELAAPVSHIWYFKGIPSRMGLILDMSPRALEKILYFASYVVIDPKETPLLKKQLLNEKEYREAADKYGEESFVAGMGAEAVKQLLGEIDLEAQSIELKEELKQSTGQKKVRIIRRLEVIESFKKSGNDPKWMIIDVIPVIPPDLRPMVQLDGGRFATSDLNDLYRRVINRNNRLKKLLDLGAPDIIVRNEKRMLQEAVDALVDNGRRGRAVTGPGNRPLKSLSDMLKGKQGRFRQNLLGKRVDYSGRSVIVVGPELKMYQCGLPKEMALELFKPFVMKKLVEDGIAHNIKSAKRMVERVMPQVWDVLEEVIADHPVLLNRAPTLHRLGIQAFQPVLVEGRAIKLHPLVCTAYNADFDGDQMAVHVPLSVEAQAEARFLMLAAGNILKPSDGKPVCVPTQDMVLGSYYLTIDKEQEKEDKYFYSKEEAIMAYELKEIGVHDKIHVKLFKTVDGVEKTGIIKTTVGKLIFNESIPQDLGFVDRNNKDEEFNLEVDFLVTKKSLGKIIDKCYLKHGPTETSIMLDKIKALGYHYSSIGAITVAASDMIVPKEKYDLLRDADETIEKIEKMYKRGFISDDERYERVIEKWTKTTEEVADTLMESLDKFNPIFMMADSGARGSKSQIKQLAGMRGLMASPSGKIIELPIRASFREGLDVLEYFLSTHGARKGNADTALKTADSGYLTRRLVDVSQDVIVREEDCGATDGMVVSEIREGNEVVEGLAERLTGRYLAEDVINPSTGEVIANNDTYVDSEMAETIVATGVKKVKIRSVFTCKCKIGVCAKCYGMNMATAKKINIGEAVGIIAAQSIGEPGTQLTMRTFHTGGVAGADITQGLPRVEELFEARKPKGLAIVSEISGTVRIEETKKKRTVYVMGADGEEKSYDIPFGSRLKVNDNDVIEAGDEVTEGSVNPHDIMNIKGIDGARRYLLSEVQKVYRLQGVDINDKHLEVVVRQMTRKIKVTDSGDTELLPGTMIDIFDFEEANEKVRASFQETTRVLTEAAIKGKTDPLVGLKENVIIGKLIPAGTGMMRYRSVKLDVEEDLTMDDSLLKVE